MAKYVSHGVVVGVCAFVYFFWKFEIFPHSIARFMNSWGVHFFAAVAWTVGVRVFFTFIDRFAKEPASLWFIGVACSLGLTLDELSQYFVPGRVVDVLDIIIQIVGVLIALAYLKLIEGAEQKRAERQ